MGITPYDKEDAPADDAKSISEHLLADKDQMFARLLLTHENKKTAIHPDDYDIEERLTNLGLIANENITPLGREVAEILRAAGVRAK